MPGRRRPAVRLDMCSDWRACAFCSASLRAAVTRSSSISTSPASTTSGAMLNDRTSKPPVRVMVTAPPPALPSAVLLSSSCCALASLDCICCIWRIISRFIFMDVSSLAVANEPRPHLAGRLHQMPPRRSRRAARGGRLRVEDTADVVLAADDLLHGLAEGLQIGAVVAGVHFLGQVLVAAGEA